LPPWFRLVKLNHLIFETINSICTLGTLKLSCFFFQHALCKIIYISLLIFLLDDKYEWPPHLYTHGIVLLSLHFCLRVGCKWCIHYYRFKNLKTKYCCVLSYKARYYIHLSSHTHMSELWSFSLTLWACTSSGKLAQVGKFPPELLQFHFGWFIK
jgi:hypothetical protein